MDKEYKTQFTTAALNARYHNELEWLAYCGQPMLYDGELYVTRRQIKPGTYDYYR